METPGTVSDRYIKASKANRFSYQDELEILEFLVKKFNLTSKTDFAKKEGVSVQAISKRISSGREMSIVLAGREMVIN